MNSSLPEKRVISTDQEMTSLIGELKVDAPLPIQNALSSQLQIINFVQSPKLSDSVLTLLISNLETSLNYCTNTSQRKNIRNQFSLMIQNLIFFLDARSLSYIKKNKELSKTLFVNAGELFSDSMKNLMLIATQCFGTVVKVGTDAVDVVGTNAMNAAIGIGTEFINSAKTGVSETSHADGSVTTEEKGLDPEIAKSNVEMGKHTIDTINSNVGELSDRISSHVDQWQDRIDNIIINNIFSQEQIEKKKAFYGDLYDWWNQDESTNEEIDSFYETINNTILKLQKYRQYIGKSIIISDMIERYLPELRLYLIEKRIGRSKGGLLDKPVIKKFPTTKVIKSILSVKNDIADSTIHQTKIAEVDSVIDEYHKLAQTFSKTSELIDPSFLGLSNSEQIYFDTYKDMFFRSELHRDRLERMRIQLNISIPRAKEIEDFF